MPDSSKAQLNFLPLGDCGLLVEVGVHADAETISRVRALADHLAQLDLPGIRDLVPALCTIGIHYDPEQWRDATAKRSPYEILAARIQKSLPDLSALAASDGQAREIPVCYEADYALDLASLARMQGLSPEQVIEMHSGVQYSVYMIGFAPGFAYLGPLDERLTVPRRETPRTRVPAGSVAVANQYTGIYPGALPGGWHVIGRTPLRLFDSSCSQPSLLRAGDQVRFTPIGVAEFRRLQDAKQ